MKKALWVLGMIVVALMVCGSAFGEEPKELNALVKELADLPNDHLMAPIPHPKVLHASSNGYMVTADNFVWIHTPNKKEIRVTNIGFVGKCWNLPPKTPILCSWDPSQTWLGILIPNDKGTEIEIFSLKTNQLLAAKRDWSQYPEWYRSPQKYQETTPTHWNGNSLNLNTVVYLKDGEKRSLAEKVVVTGDTYTISAIP